MDPSTATGCRHFCSDQPDALRIASREDDLGSSPSGSIAAARPMPRVAPVSTTTVTQPTYLRPLASR